MKKDGVISFGEVMVDLISVDRQNLNYQPYLGGATINVAVGVSKQGIPSYYLCKIGVDETSQFAKEELVKQKVDLTYSSQSLNKKLCKVTIQLDENGERVFHSYLNETPDEWLMAEELNQNVFNHAKLFYFGSGTLFHHLAKSTTIKALEMARQSNLMIAFDANIRIKRWGSEEECRTTIMSFFKKADIVKMSEEELLFLTNSSYLEEALQRVEDLNIPYLLITLGAKGAMAVWEGSRITVPGVKVNVVDTTGAGDAFMAAILYCFHKQGYPNSVVTLTEYLQYANQMGAQATTRLGGL
ncbi:carbohydrate kinase family protein [Bacillus sp. AK128]